MWESIYSYGASTSIYLNLQGYFMMPLFKFDILFLHPKCPNKFRVGDINKYIRYIWHGNCYSLSLFVGLIFRYALLCLIPIHSFTLIARFMWPTWGPSWADRTQVGPMLAHELCYLGSYQQTILGINCPFTSVSALPCKDFLSAGFVSEYYIEFVAVEPLGFIFRIN